MIVAGVGIVINGVTAWLFASGRKGDLNIRGAFLHMAADAVVSAGVVAAGLVIIYTGWTWLDPVVSLAIAAVIIVGTWSLLRESVASSLGAVPTGIEPKLVRGHLEALPRRRRDARPSHLADEHNRGRTDLPFTNARRPSRR